MNEATMTTPKMHEGTIRRIFEFLFPNADKEKFESFRTYVLNDIKNSECDYLVLYRVNKKFAAFMQLHQLDCGKKEVICPVWGNHPRFIEDYSKRCENNFVSHARPKQPTF